MDVDHKPLHKVLQDFTAVLLQRNPMNLGKNNPLEYEAEALSILSRFTESALHLADDEGVVAQVATGIVKQALEFWFENIDNLDPEPIARELIGVYRTAMEGSSAPTEPVNDDIKQVTSVTIGE